MKNSFDQLRVDGINRSLEGSDAVCKLSKRYINSAVIGVPGKPGSVMLCRDFVTTNYPGRGVWLCHYSETMTPESMANDVVAFGQTEEEQFLYWNDLLKYLKSIYC